MDRELLKLARNTIREKLNLDFESIEMKEEWNEKAATFVTLSTTKGLRGCIGSLNSVRPLFQDVKENAISAAFRDPRFPPLTEREIDDIKIEISQLSPLTEIHFKDEEDLISQIVPFKMGLVLEFIFNRGTFLPQVWEYYPEPKEFFEHLKLKAGLATDFYEKEMKVYYYEVEKCQE